MDAIHDQPAIDIITIKSRAHHAGRAMLQRRHSIIEMCDAAHAMVETGDGFFIGGVGMARADDDARAGQRDDLFGRGQFRRDGQHHHAPARAGEQRHRGIVKAAQARRAVNALARGVDEGAFDMHADDAGNALRNGIVHRIERGSHRLDRIADQRGQQRGRAKAGMSRRNRGHAINRRAIVEQSPAAAIDLRIDKAGQQIAAVQVEHRIGIARIIDGHDLPAIHR